MDEAAFLNAIAPLASHPGARGFRDDAAVLGDLVLTKDMMVEGVHWLPGTAAADVAWKLVAANLSDLAAKGAAPEGVLLGYRLGGDAGWDAGFVDGLGAALAAFGVPLLGGDTVSGTGPRVLSMTAIGRAAATGVPDRRGARAGDRLWVTGTVGDAGLGLAIARGGIGPDMLLGRHLRPTPRLAEGRRLAVQVSAMADVSDGVLIDAARMAAASGLAVAVDLAALPLSPAAIAMAGDGRAARMAAATAGDDYELLFACPEDATPDAGGLAVTCIGRFAAGTGLTLADGGAVPERLGWVHGAGCQAGEA